MDAAALGVSSQSVARLLAKPSAAGNTREFWNASIPNTGPYTFSINGLLEDIDFTIDGDTIANLLHIDASLNAIIFNDNGGDADLRIEGDTNPNLISMDAGLDAVGIGASPTANVLLDVVSTTKAFRPPVMTTTQRDAIGSPQNGMIIWNSTTGQLEDYNGGWAAV